MTSDLDRRTFLRSTATASALTMLAGCSGGSGESGDGAGPDGSSDNSGDGGSDDTGDAGGENASTEPSSTDVEEYVGGSSNYDGQTVVHTDQDEVTISVGVEGNGGAFAFDPPAVKVSTGTTVVWEWTGEGGTHNVVSEGNGPLDSGSAVAEEGTTYQYTFEETGTFLYKCVPHASLNMVGAVVVE